MSAKPRRPRTVPQSRPGNGAGAGEPHHGQDLARARVAAGLTQTEAAKRLGMSPIALSKIEGRPEALPAYKREGFLAIYARAVA